ncbi:MAG: hypothetical protein SGJ27_24810 [Candidatus Melainabacteria bacterium]|nr:hypothetical protein [Candidatus Melainabacteria bacterium]
MDRAGRAVNPGCLETNIESSQAHGRAASETLGGLLISARHSGEQQSSPHSWTAAPNVC